jgi:hypothetical protein
MSCLPIYSKVSKNIHIPKVEKRLIGSINKVLENISNCVIWQDSLDKIQKKVLIVGNIIRVKSSDYNENYNNFLKIEGDDNTKKFMNIFGQNDQFLVSLTKIYS